MSKVYLKSPLNYLGNKHKLLKGIIPLLPSKIETFYDVFCGGLDLSLNVNANKIVANDANSDLIWLFNEMKKDTGNVMERLQEIEKVYFPMNEHEGKAIRSWQEDKEIFNKLLEDKKVSYYSLREVFNNTNLEDRDYTILLSLIINSFGLIEFRSKDNHVTFTCGKGRLNKKIEKSMPVFKSKIDSIEFYNNDFRMLYDIDFQENDFVYLDPPYLNTSQYKDRWTQKDEEDLYDLLNHLNKSGVKFALSNFKDGENHTNEYLENWCKDYNVNYLEDKHHLLNRFDKDNRIEILITNYR